jgi:hypothetical protein
MHIVFISAIGHEMIQFSRALFPLKLLGVDNGILSFSIYSLPLHLHSQGLCLLGKHSATWAMPPVPFAFSYFSDRVTLFTQDQP